MPAERYGNYVYVSSGAHVVHVVDVSCVLNFTFRVWRIFMAVPSNYNGRPVIYGTGNLPINCTCCCDIIKYSFTRAQTGSDLLRLGREKF